MTALPWVYQNHAKVRDTFCFFFVFVQKRGFGVSGAALLEMFDEESVKVAIARMHDEQLDGMRLTFFVCVIVIDFGI